MLLQRRASCRQAELVSVASLCPPHLATAKDSAFCALWIRCSAVVNRIAGVCTGAATWLLLRSVLILVCVCACACVYMCAVQQQRGDYHGSVATLAAAARTVPRFVSHTARPLLQLWFSLLRAVAEAVEGCVFHCCLTVSLFVCTRH